MKIGDFYKFLFPCLEFNNNELKIIVFIFCDFCG